MALLICLVFLLSFPSGDQAQTLEFAYDGFNDAALTLDGSATIDSSGALRLTDFTNNVVGHAFHPIPIPLFVNASSSFSAYFVFVIAPPRTGTGGYGLAFALAPSPQIPGAGSEHFLGLFNPSNDGNASNHIFAVEFDTVNGHNENSDNEGNHVGIDINSVFSNATEPAAYYVNGTRSRKEEIDLESGIPIQAWIEYDGEKGTVNVTIYPLSLGEKPTTPLISHPVNLSSYLKERVYAGFSASTGREASPHYILGWSFRMNGPAPSLNISQLPVLPVPKFSSSSNLQIKIIIASLSSVALLLVVTVIAFVLYKRLAQGEVLEDWELDCPHRFRYKDLHKATKGFKESELLGVGGFGAVYKGMLPKTRSEVAVKKITRNSIQGMREFAAEIESLGRLRHKNLVNLQGWCKKKNQLLLVYDYIPNGSLDNLLLYPKDDFFLSWDERLNIIKGIAAGLLYLHEEWEQLVVHRDVKSSNVLIDADMNARLGDFGLARLYDHGGMPHTTNVVGTIGYIAPELARTGKPSASSDVYAFGVVLLEVACARRPIGSNNFILVDWVIECYRMGRILDAVDPKLDSSYNIEEIELILKLGLLCSHQNPEARPTIRHVTRYLHAEDLLPPIEIWGDSLAHQTSLRFFEGMPCGVNTSYDDTSSMGFVTYKSVDAGR